MSNHSRDNYPRQQQGDQRQRGQDQKQRQQQQIEEKSLSTNSLNDKLAVAGNSTPTQGNAGNTANGGLRRDGGCGL
ncbi:MAG: hypothetical protein AAAC50_14425 [Rhizobium altiplani]|jgi:hypothetical protein|uniref:hypothetical protein n=1 Tax=Rhizobium altiplani TaxID=1864509 RepID=UPI000DD54310